MDNTGTLLAKSASLQELAILLNPHIQSRRGENHLKTAIEGLSIIYSEPPVEPFRSILGPAMCMTIQGADQAIAGDSRFYPEGQASIISADVPYRSVASSSGSTQPHLGIVIELDPAYTQDVVQELGVQTNSSSRVRRCGACVVDLTSQLLNCVLRLVRLLDTPKAIPILYPSIMREICYWLLTGPASIQIADTMLAGVCDKRVLRTIQRLRCNFTKQIRVEELASAAGMSPATFHRQFKSVTSMSPLQYQKKLRLLEGRRLLTTSDLTVESTAFEVGYVSTSQFSREYTRMFGKPPRRDITCRSSQSLATNVA